MVLRASLLILALVASACGGSGSDTPLIASSSQTSSSVVEASARPDAGVNVTGAVVAKPAIEIPETEPPNDLRIVDLVEGDGDEVGEGFIVTAHYVGVSWLNDGGEFDTSWGGDPVAFPLDRVIPGWTEGIPGMRVGGRRLLVIPPELAYGSQPPSPAIAADDTLVFVVDVVATEDPNAPLEISDDPAGVEVFGALDAKPEITLPETDPPAGLHIVDLIEGDGDVVPEGATVTAQYVGVSWLNDGAQFDASWDSGSPIPFNLDRVIRGWTEGIPGMKVGGRRLLIIPAHAGYRDNPPSPDIAPGDTLVFVVDVVAFE